MVTELLKWLASAGLVALALGGLWGLVMIFTFRPDIGDAVIAVLAIASAILLLAVAVAVLKDALFH